MFRSIITNVCIAFMAFCLFVCAAVSCNAVAPQQDPAAKQNEPAAHEPADHEPAANRLANETSPYLLMHAHNPVDWYPWGEAALQKARQENKVIFLSIGYSSCHWCHVMERESFLDQEIAQFMNDNFVCIKVDREERPDVDAIYMTSLHVYNQLTDSRRGGGWPLSMFLTPDAEPFFGGTYFPARDGDRGAGAGFLTIIQKVQVAWSQRRDFVKRDAARITEFTRRELDGKRAGDGGEIKAAWIEDCLIALKNQFDPDYGGYGFSSNNPRLPKFPQASNLFFLIDVWQNSPQDTDARRMLEKTLDGMALGGIYDHIGDGFHRYSVDRFWRIPHFEKMLYDNGQLLSVYAEAYQLNQRDDYRRVAEGIAAYVLREMRSDEGGFYAALDAESEGEEGKFYRWSRAEIQSALNDDQYQLFAQVYGIDLAPNFEQQYYAPQRTQRLEQEAKNLGLSEPQLWKRLVPIRKKLLAIRERRARPLTDTKILTSWNGLMIRGLADAGRILDKDSYTAAAASAADFIWENMVSDGRLKRTHTAGQARLNAYLEDYAFLIDGLCSLHRADGQKKWLDRALELQRKQDELFWDATVGGYFYTSHDHESLLARAKRPTDSAVPSGNSVSASNLLYLAEHAGQAELAVKARGVASSAAGLITQFSTASPRLLIAVRKMTSQ